MAIETRPRAHGPDGTHAYASAGGNNKINFYADAEISAQGWNWVVASNSNPLSEQQWPANYSSRNAPYPSESNDPAIAPNSPDNAYFWQRLSKAGTTFRNYGFYVSTDAQGNSVAGDPVLNANTDPAFRGYNLACPDSPNSFTPLATPPRNRPPYGADERTQLVGWLGRLDYAAVEIGRVKGIGGLSPLLVSGTPRLSTTSVSLRPSRNRRTCHPTRNHLHQPPDDATPDHTQTVLHNL